MIGGRRERGDNVGRAAGLQAVDGCVEGVVAVCQHLIL